MNLDRFFGCFNTRVVHFGAFSSIHDAQVTDDLHSVQGWSKGTRENLFLRLKFLMLHSTVPSRLSCRNFVMALSTSVLSIFLALPRYSSSVWQSSSTSPLIILSLIRADWALLGSKKGKSVSLYKVKSWISPVSLSVSSNTSLSIEKRLLLGNMDGRP